jgi:hypothetical protein
MVRTSVAPNADQCMPDRLRRCPMMALRAA